MTTDYPAKYNGCADVSTATSFDETTTLISIDMARYDKLTLQVVKKKTEK